MIPQTLTQTQPALQGHRRCSERPHSIRHAGARKVAPPRQKAAPVAAPAPRPVPDATSLAVAARVEHLLRRSSSEAVNRELDALVSESAAGRFSAGARARLLLFVGTGVACGRASRRVRAGLRGLIGDELRNGLEDTPHGRTIERHRGLLCRLVLRGCRLRGEIAPFSAPRKEAADANA